MAVNRNPTPKEQFLSNKKVVEAHNSMMQSVQMDISINTALLQYAHDLMVKTPESMPGAGHYKLVGAMEFVRVLRTLSETATNPKAADRDNLDHHA